MVVDAALQDRHRRVRSVVVEFDQRAERVDPGGLQPLLTPGRQVTAAGLLQVGEQVREPVLPHACSAK